MMSNEVVVRVNVPTVWLRPLLQIPINLLPSAHRPWVVFVVLECITHVEMCTGRRELELVYLFVLLNPFQYKYIG
jgi:hypothetical protein